MRRREATIHIWSRWAIAVCHTYRKTWRSESEIKERVTPIAWEALVDTARNGDLQMRSAVLGYVTVAVFDFGKRPQEVFELLEAARGDPDPQVRKTAQKYLDELHLRDAPAR